MGRLKIAMCTSAFGMYLVRHQGLSILYEHLERTTRSGIRS
jgi:UPF0716 family protein affecting phage T7 exclusion